MKASAARADSIRVHPRGLALRSLALCLLGVALFIAVPGKSAVAHADDVVAASGFDLTLERATELQDAGSYDAALQIYRSLQQDRPADPHLLYELARASLSAGELSGCVHYAQQSSSISSRFQAVAFGILAKCQQRADGTGAAMSTLSLALERFPQDATLHFELAMALRATDPDASATEFASALRLASSAPDLYLAYGALLDTEAQSGGALLMNLRYIMAAPQSPAAMGAAERVLKAVDGEAAYAAAKDPLATVLIAARRGADDVNTTEANRAGRLNRFLQGFVLGVVTAEDPVLKASPLWSGAVEPLLTMADHDVLDTFLHFVGALARTEGSPEWLSAHRAQFEKLVEFLAQQGTT